MYNGMDILNELVCFNVKENKFNGGLDMKSEKKTIWYQDICSSNWKQYSISDYKVV